MNKSLLNQQCHDCNKEIIITEEEITNGVLLTYKDSADKIDVYKCDECFEKNKELSNYIPCEVYTRIVGYLRPKSSANPGKAQELKERVNYKVE